MLKGVDVSNWQAGISIRYLDVDFCICKATEGLDFVDVYCNGFVEECKAHGILWGFYHFARENSPQLETRFFYDNCKGYIGHGIPVLDYEVENKSNVKWCESFIETFHDLSGIWPLLYISASRCAEYAGSWIPDKCGLWVAGYPQPYIKWTDDAMPYDIAPFDCAAIWQFTDVLDLDGWNLDGDLAYMDKEGWSAYAKGFRDAPEHDEDALPVKPPIASKSCEELADEVLAGKWGNGWNRQQALDAAYGKGTYDHVQCIVNMRLGLDGC